MVDTNCAGTTSAGTTDSSIKVYVNSNILLLVIEYCNRSKARSESRSITKSSASNSEKNEEKKKQNSKE